MKIIDLSKAKNADHIRSKSKLFEFTWYLIENTLFCSPILPFSSFRVWILKLFGAKMGKNIIIRSKVKVKYPWKIKIGDNCWIGEEVWIHNQDEIEIANDVVISQGVFITTGTHDYKNTMDHISSPIFIDSGVWISSRSMITRGVRIGKSSLILPMSLVVKDTTPGGVYSGIPAKFLKERFDENNS